MEMNKNKCKLCDIKISDTNFDLIDAVIKNVLDDLLPDMKFEDGMQYLICSICSVKLFAALDFKSVCLSTNNTILPYVNIEEPSPVDLKQVYMNENGHSILEDKQICRLCIHPVNDECISVETGLASTIEMYIPDINFKMTVDPIICKMCHDSLFTHISFIKNCLNVEQRRNKDDCLMDIDLIDSIKTEEMEIKREKDDEEEQEKSSETHFFEILLKEEIKQERDPLQFSDNETNMDNIEECKSEQLQQPKKESDEYNLEAYNIYTLEINVNENDSSIKHQTVNGSSQRSKVHKLRNKDSSKGRIYKCNECEFETKHRNALKKHLWRHKDPSQVQMYKCSECKYETKYKEDLGKHQLRHKDPSEVEMYKCSECQYETRFKTKLRTHQLVHKDTSEIEMYKCGECPYETKFKRNLRMHQLKHRDPSEVEMYKCSECKYESRYKNAVVAHQFMHKDPSEVKMYKCSECKYQCRYKTKLERHRRLKHKDPSKMEIYKCTECKYEGRYKTKFERHQLKHKDPSEVEMYKCTECEFETKYKKNLETHQLKHKDPSELQMYKCSECTYETRYRSALIAHQLKHKDPSEVKMYKCSECQFETKYKKNLDTHHSKHKDSSKVKMFSSECKYEAK